MSKPINVFHVASEVAPFSMSGGLAQIARNLPVAIQDLGHQVSIITPLFRDIHTKKHHLAPLFKDVPLRIDDDSLTTVHFWQGQLNRHVRVFFVEHRKSFSLHKRLYGSKYDNERFWLFNLAAIKLLLLLKERVNVIHCHDWQAGFIPQFLNTRFKKYTLFKNTATLFTIHNLVFQMGGNWWEVPSERKDDGRRALPNYKDHERVKSLNFSKRGIIHSTGINTVSEQYAKEILTKKFGERLYGILKNKNKRGRLYGIINGINEDEYNPATDPGLYKNYSVDTLEDREANKRGLQRRYHLPQKKDIPVIGMVTRITEQKGFDLLIAIIPTLVKFNLQLIIFGGGDRGYEKKLRSLQRKYPKKIGIHLQFQRKDATKVFAGSDLLLMPSRFEPCGIIQMESMRYGSIPIVRGVGGLVDTVTDYNPRTQRGNGFVFSAYQEFALFAAIIRAVESYRYTRDWKILVERTMRVSHSWEIPAKKYITLYRKLLHLHKTKNHKPNQK